MCSSSTSSLSIMALHGDIIESHILTRLDGCTLASIASCSTTLHHLISSHDKLWSDICQSTWPSASSPRVNQLISSFPPQAFFSQAYPLPTTSNLSRSFSSSEPPSELISAVDIHYKGKLVFTKIQETKTLDDRWFLMSRFSIDLLNEVPVPIKHPDTCEEIVRDTTLTWILIDPIGRRAVNLSSHKAVKAKRRCVTGEVQLRFDSILDGHVRCRILVTCGGSEDDEVGMHLRDVSLEMEDMDGMHLRGKDSLVILHGALEGKRGNGRNRVVEARRRYEEFMEMKRERRERRKRKSRIKGTIDMMCSVGFGVSISVSFLLVFICLRKIDNGFSVPLLCATPCPILCSDDMCS